MFRLKWSAQDTAKFSCLVPMATGVAPVHFAVEETFVSLTHFVIKKARRPFIFWLCSLSSSIHRLVSVLSSCKFFCSYQLSYQVKSTPASLCFEDICPWPSFCHSPCNPLLDYWYQNLNYFWIVLLDSPCGFFHKHECIRLWFWWDFGYKFLFSPNIVALTFSWHLLDTE